MRVTMLAAFSLLGAGLAAAPAESASASPAAAEKVTAGACRVQVPARIATKAVLTNYPMTLVGSDCPAGTYATLEARWRNGHTMGYGCARGDCPDFSVHIDHDPPGRVSIVALGPGETEDGRQVTVLPGSTEIRFHSTATLTVGRKGTRTAFLAKAWYFSPKTKSYVRWSGWKLLLQYQEVGSTTWKGLAYVTTNAAGQAAYTYYPGRARKYRLSVPGTASVWNFATPTVTR